MGLLGRSRLLGAAVAAVVVASTVVLAAQPLKAQQVDPNEEFRAKLQMFFDEADAVFAKAEIAPTWSSAAARQGVASLRAEQLAALREAVPPSVWTMWKTTGPQVVIAATAGGRRVAGGLAMLSCPEWTQADAIGLLAAQSTALVFAAAWDAVVGDPTGVSTAVAAAAKAAPDVAVLVLEQKKLKHDDCVADEDSRIIQDVLGPNVDEKVSTRASQTSIDDLKQLLTGMLDELKNLINARASGIESLMNSRANGIENLTNDRANKIEALVNKREDYADTYQANVVAHQQLDLQVIEIERGRLLLVASEAGKTVAVTLTNMKVAELRQGPISFVDVTATTGVRQDASGALEITLDMRGPAKDAVVYLVTVAHDHGVIAPIGRVTHTGTTIHRRNGT